MSQHLEIECSHEDQEDEGQETGSGRQPAPVDYPASLFFEIPDSKAWRKKRMSKSVRRRRSMHIRAYVGPNGHGKSALAVMDLLPTLRGIRWNCDDSEHEHTKLGVVSGWRRVLSTVKITLPSGEDHPLYTRLDDWRLVLEAEHADMLFDEVTGIANSRDSMSLPRQVQVILDQLRKRDLTLSFTAPSFQRADTTLRTTAIGITECRGYAPEADRAGSSAWGRKRLFRARTFAAADFSDWTDGKRDKIKPGIVQWWWGPGSEVFQSYSSKGAVSRLGQSSDSGRCLDCGGVRRAPACTCKS